MFLQAMDVNRLHETLDGCELVVVVDHQMTDTAKWADIVLPAATWYEKTDLTATPLHPYLQIQQEAIPPVGESRPELWMWQEIVKRIDPALFEQYFDVTAEEAIEAMLAQGGATEGITLEQLKAGPVRLDVPDPDVAFVRQVEELVPFPPQSLPAPLEATAAFIPTRRAEFYKEEDRFLELGEAVPTYKPPHDDEVHDPAEYPIALLSPHSKWRIHSSYANVAWLNEITGGRAPVLLQPEHRRRARHRRGRPRGAAQHPRQRPRLGAPDARRPARHRHPLRGLVEPAARRRQERQRAHLLRGEPHPRDPLRGQHVGAVDRLEGLPLRGHEDRRRYRRGDRRGGRARRRRGPGAVRQEVTHG